MTETTDVTGAETMPEGELSPPAKPRLPVALQLVSGLLFLAGAIAAAAVVGVLIMGAYTVVCGLIEKGALVHPGIYPDWSMLAIILTGIFLMLAGRAMLALRNVWRVLVLIALWLAAAVLLFSLVWACRRFWASPLTSRRLDSLVVAPVFAANLLIIVLLTCRSATKAFGGSYSRVHRLVVSVGVVIILVIAVAILVVLFGHRKLAEAGLII